MRVIQTFFSAMNAGIQSTWNMFILLILALLITPVLGVLQALLTTTRMCHPIPAVMTLMDTSSCSRRVSSSRRDRRRSRLQISLKMINTVERCERKNEVSVSPKERSLFPDFLLWMEIFSLEDTSSRPQNEESFDKQLVFLSFIDGEWMHSPRERPDFCRRRKDRQSLLSVSFHRQRMEDHPTE